MAGLTGISPEDFHRLQTQILDLRTANYALQEESLKHRTELMQLNVKYEALDKEYQKAQKTIEKSRKAKDVELLFAENEGLQRKLVAQEEEFRLQNQTLLQELATVVRASEQMEKELADFRSGRANADPDKGEVQRCSQSTECDLSSEEFNQALQAQNERYAELEKQKKELEEMLEKEQNDWKSHQKKLNGEVSDLQQKLASLQVVADKVLGLEESILHLNQENHKLKNDLVLLEDRLKITNEEHEERVRELEEIHRNAVLKLEKEHEEKESDWRIQLEIAAAQRTEFEEAASRARQEAVDAAEDVRIAERRIATVTQDLRKQLRAERRRADKLQERLRDLVNDGANSHVTVPTRDSDNCSVSSWSMMSGPQDSSTPTATPVFTNRADSIHNTSAEDAPDAQELVNENAKLVSRLASLQQEKWLLEERVTHLEEANAAMTDEMMRRGKLIQHYCMEGKAASAKDATPGTPQTNGEKLSVRKMVNMLRNGEDSSADQRKLQRILEETLTKNMHLQEDLEHLSREVVRLSQLLATDKK